jgi:hypothetical protein
MPRGLHPKTLPQRDGREGHWSVLPRTSDQVERHDAPMRSMGRGIVGTMIVLLLIVGGVLTLINAIKPRTPQLAGKAHAYFHTASPRLLVSPAADRMMLEKAHRAPGDAAIDRAMDRVVRQGWGDTTPPPNRADVATGRAEVER